MSHKPSGRFSRYPAVNRDVLSLSDREVVVNGVVAEEVTSSEPVVITTTRVEVAEVQVAEDFDFYDSEDDDLDDSHLDADGILIDIAEMTARQVLDWVGDDEIRREFALQSESEGRARKGLLSELAG